MRLRLTMMDRMDWMVVLVIAFFLAIGRSVDGLDLLNKSIQTRTDVTNQASLSLDIRDMRLACRSRNAGEALNIYKNGKNSPLSNSGGNKRNFVSFLSSADDLSSMTWIFHLLGHLDSSDRNNDGRDPIMEQILQKNALTTDIMIRNLFTSAEKNDNNEEDCLLAVEATVATQLFFQTTQSLWKGVWKCARSSQDEYDPNADNRANENVDYIDEFIAFWVGLGTDHENALYNLSRQAALDFNTMDPLIPNSSKVHSNIRTWYEEASGVALSQPNACTPKNPQTAGHLWNLANLIQTQMYIPLIQKLIQALATADQKKIKVYAQAIIPQLVQFSNKGYDSIKELLLDTTPTTDYNQRITQLQTFFPLLGITCADIGGLSSLVPVCQDPPLKLLTSYTPRSDVQQHSRLALDAHQMKLFLLMEFSSTTWDFAEYIYRYGKNSIQKISDDRIDVEFRSFQQLGRTQHRKSAEAYLWYEQYFNDPYYADTTIVSTFAAINGWKWSDVPKTTKRDLIMTTVTSQIMWMIVSAEMADAISDCKAGDAFKENDSDANAWDEVAAFSTLLSDLIQLRSTQFVIPNDIQNANEELNLLLLAGQSQLRRYDCKSLQLTVDMLTSLLMVPLYQSVLFYADVNQNIDAFDGNGHVVASVAAGEASANALIPALQVVNADTGNILKENLIVSRGVKPVSDGPQRVADALAITLNHYKLSCVNIGLRNEIDICKKYTPPSTNNPDPDSSTSIHTNNGILVIVLLLSIFSYHAIF